MDALLGGIKNSASESNKEQHHQSSSPSDLLSSAKAVAEAAQYTLKNETDKVDKAKIADAAENIIEAASKYGKLEGTPVGQYVEKAETYLHQYHSSQPSTTTTTTATTTPSEPPTTTKPPSEPEQKGEEKSGSGVGDYVKMAQGFLHKE